MVVLDKTGTITKGQPAVTDILVNGSWIMESSINHSPLTENDLLRLAASVERGSEHPLGEAIWAEATNRGLTLSEPSSVQSGSRLWRGS